MKRASQKTTPAGVPSESLQNGVEQKIVKKVKKAKKRKRRKIRIITTLPFLIILSICVGAMIYFVFAVHSVKEGGHEILEDQLDDKARQQMRRKRYSDLQERAEGRERREPPEFGQHGRGHGRGPGRGHEGGDGRGHGRGHEGGHEGGHGLDHEGGDGRGHKGGHEGGPGGRKGRPSRGPRGAPKRGVHKPEIDEIGDFSEEYKKIYEKYEKIFPPEGIESRASFVEKIRKNQYKAKFGEDEIGYDVFNCPDDPPEGYPAQFHTLDIIKDWNPDDTKPRDSIYQGICIFNHATEYDKAVRYREAELPFVIRDDPEVLQSVERWNHPDYLKEVLGMEDHRAELSTNNHFMYWNGGRKKDKSKNWVQPTENIRMSYKDWLSHADTTHQSIPDINSPHWYFRLIGCGFMGVPCDKGNSEWLFNDLTFFKPDYVETLYLVEPEEEKGIHCRFGMDGVIAENHFDATRNMIVVLGGERRYILSHPDECENLALYERNHPSARHSMVDWSNPDLEKYPAFDNANSNEIVLQAGDVLYLPTDWFHYIISLGLNYQCNARSGKTNDYQHSIRECGF